MDRKNQISYSLGLGEPNYSTPNFIIREACYEKRFTRYSNPVGDFLLRKKISEKLKLIIRLWPPLMKL